jgi:2-iminobutanoate/2-iminopropanoate deaminase
MSEGCQKKIISTEKAPKAIGPYSAGVKVSHFVYTAGQLGLDPTTGNLVTGGVEAETRQALQNLKAILEAADAKLEDVVKTTVFLKDMNDFQKMNGIYAEFFASDAPARSAVQVAALPKGGAVEIEVVAFISSETCDCC